MNVIPCRGSFETTLIRSNGDHFVRRVLSPVDIYFSYKFYDGQRCLSLIRRGETGPKGQASIVLTTTFRQRNSKDDGIVGIVRGLEAAHNLSS